MNTPGDKAGYVVLILDRFTPDAWNETPSGIFTSVADAVSMVDAYEGRQHGSANPDTYAIGKVTLSMISRPS